MACVTLSEGYPALSRNTAETNRWAADAMWRLRYYAGEEGVAP